MQSKFLMALASTALILSVATFDSNQTAAAAQEGTAQNAPNLNAAVAAPGRIEADVNLDASRKPVDVLGFMGLETGDAVLDIFAGGGYYSEVMGAAVGPTGSVVAVNPPQFVSSDAAKTKWTGIATRQPGVSLMPSQLGDYTPEPDSFDFAMMHLIYHDLYWESEKFKIPQMDPAAFLTKLYAGMKPGGIVAVIDHVGSAGDTRAIVEKTHRIDPVTVKTDFEKAGFVLESESDMFANPEDDLDKNVFDPSVRGKTNRFMIKFRKPA
ncbi:class I SAM-dependent methyltransferase [Parasphingorhabdus cellanae]|uniref:Class I SAM-dependent methyltransferase n=1 Tax=Parasphingorhabdus cellanae TaxID=2806553 RepID=A0ABX7T9P5_9SPHN|nr:class I SAM-dependent methyltransferase [Parasphingorhabdus cellanae]QTD57027.1 class I SAM-dependent methyltransferase [Parasphingorhabdus cellanae]